MTNWMHRWTRAAAGSALVAGLAMATPAWAADPPDAWVTTKAKLALLTTEGVSSTDVNVDTTDGKVTLHGTVGSEQEKARAEKAVRDVKGVKEVRNMLAVVPPAKQDAVAAKDDQVKEQVERALAADKSLADSSIKVSSVNNGAVVLSGTANSMSDHLTAVEDARRVPGVRRVASEIKSPDALSDAEIWRDTKGQAKDTADTATGAMSDMWITTASKVRLLANGDTPAMQINVDTDDGVVTLFGMVPTEASKRAAEAEVAKVSGVKKVRNQLQVVAEPAQEAVKANDEEIKDHIAKRMDDALSDDADIKVEVKDGVARLSGEVDGQSDRLRALTIARSTSGVRSVVDQIEVDVQ
ncbi:MAG: BON domain-containing protein [Candidatus Binatia bacterium]